MSNPYPSNTRGGGRGVAYTKQPTSRIKFTNYLVLIQFPKLELSAEEPIPRGGQSKSFYQPYHPLERPDPVGTRGLRFQYLFNNGLSELFSRHCLKPMLCMSRSLVESLRDRLVS